MNRKISRGFIFSLLLIFNSIAAPGIVTLNSPSDGTIDVPIRPAFSWYSAFNAVSYKLQVSINRWWTGSDLIVDISGITGTSYTLTTQLNALSHYYWRIVAYASDNSTSVSSEWGFTTQGTAPGIPNLSSPSDGATVSQTPTLSWSPNGTTPYYRYQVSTSSSFPAGCIDVDNYSYTDVTLSSLTANTQYYWRVGARNSYGFSGFSIARRFTTQLSLPAVPTLSQPFNGSTEGPNSTVLQWNAASGALSYNAQYSTSSNFSSDITSLTGTTSTSWNLSGLMSNVRYYWRVQARNSAGTTAWSSTWNFITQNVNPSVPGWPHGSAQDITSPFGPRNYENTSATMGVSSWFHTGIDVGNGTTIVAPFNMILREKAVSTSYMRLVFENLEVGVEPKNIQYEELSTSNSAAFTENVTTFSRGNNVSTQGGDDNYVHMDVFPTNQWIQGSANWATNRARSKNPLGWFYYKSSVQLPTGSIYQIYPTRQQTDFPTEGTKKYFDVLIRQVRPQFDLNVIRITLNNAQGGLTSDFLEYATAAEINFNENLGLDRANTDLATQETNSMLQNSSGGTGSYYRKVFNGLKIFGGYFPDNVIPVTDPPQNDR